MSRFSFRLLVGVGGPLEWLDHSTAGVVYLRSQSKDYLVLEQAGSSPTPTAC